MKIVQKSKIFVASLAAAAVLAGCPAALAVSPAGYSSFAEVEQCNDAATPEQVVGLIGQIGTVTTASRPAIVAALTAYNQLDDAGKAAVTNYAVLAEAQQVLGIKDALAKCSVDFDKVERNWDVNAPYAYACDADGSCYLLPWFQIHEEKGQYALYPGIEFLYQGTKNVAMDKVVVRAGDSLESFEGRGPFTDIQPCYELTVHSLSDDGVQWLHKILAQPEIIVRFNGSIGSADYTVTPENRQAITDVLNLYDLLKAASPEVRAKALNS